MRLGHPLLKGNIIQDPVHRTPRAGFPWDADRDDGYANVNGNGYPTCYQWWNDANAGLLKLVKEQTDEGM